MVLVFDYKKKLEKSEIAYEYVWWMRFGLDVERKKKVAAGIRYSVISD